MVETSLQAKKGGCTDPPVIVFIFKNAISLYAGREAF